MLTQNQYDRLPPLAKAIVDIDRDIVAKRAARIVQLSDVKFYRELTGRRRELSNAAHDVWGGSRSSDGTLRS